jgi:hypothetical protein
MNAVDSQLLQYLTSAINSGKSKITLTSQMLTSVSEEGLKEAKRLCKLAGIHLTVDNK